MATGRTRTLFAVDVVVAVAFLIGAVSAIAFLVPYSTVDFSTSSSAPAFLGISYRIWRTLHQYSGIMMIAGGVVHFAMHWGWFARTGMSMLSSRKRTHPLVTAAVPLAPLSTTIEEVAGDA